MTKAKLLNHTPLIIASEAIRTCWQSFDKSDSIDGACGIKDKELIHRVGNQYKHASTLEHLTYTFFLRCSRAVLQELARHRISSFSVKSSRYTAKELKNEQAFNVFIDVDDLIWGDSYTTKIYQCKNIEEVKQLTIATHTEDRGSLQLIKKEDYINYSIKIFNDYDRAKKYIVLTNDIEVNILLIESLELFRQAVAKGKSNDLSKYCMPECYRTELTWTINARSLQNFLSLRTSKQALWEIRELAYDVYEALPEEHKYLFEEYLYVE